MAGEVPKEDTSKAVPGAFIETPAGEPDSFSVKPIPASDGVTNPISLKPGEKVPDASEVTTNTVDSTVKLDKESYENADAGPAKDIAKLAEESAPPVGGVIIPESSLPMGDGAGVSPFISSAGAGTTTAELAGAVPKETTEVPAVVTESQAEANVAPEAAANPEAVEEKKEVEDELKSKVPEEPATSESGLSAGKIAGIATGSAAAAAAAVGAAAVATKDTATEAATSVGLVSGKAAETTPAEPAAAVPEVVSESIEKAHQSPEAAANPEAVAEKSAVEAELKKEVPESEAKGEPAPELTSDVGPASSASTPVTDKKAKRRSVFGKLKDEFNKLRHKDSPKTK